MFLDKIYVVLWNGNSFGVYASLDDAKREVDAMKSDGMSGGYIEEHILEKEASEEKGFKGPFWLFERSVK